MNAHHRPANGFLPLHETSIQPPSSAGSRHAAPALSRRVLLIDDDTATRRITALFLARIGYCVDAAEDGEMGWDALSTTHYDLVVTDNDMPCLTGMKLVERLRCAGLNLPVIIASGSVELGEVEDYPWLALTAILRKPFPFPDLIATVRRAVPIVPDAGEGLVYYRELRRSAAPCAPSPAHPGALPGAFAKIA